MASSDFSRQSTKYSEIALKISVGVSKAYPPGIEGNAVMMNRERFEQYLATAAEEAVQAVRRGDDRKDPVRRAMGWLRVRARWLFALMLAALGIGAAASGVGVSSPDEVFLSVVLLGLAVLVLVDPSKVRHPALRDTF